MTTETPEISEEKKSPATIDDGYGISAGYGILQDVDNLLKKRVLKT